MIEDIETALGRKLTTVEKLKLEWASEYSKENADVFGKLFADMSVQVEELRKALEEIADMHALYFLSPQHALGKSLSVARQALERTKP